MAHVVKKACIPDVSFAVAAWAGSNWHYVKINNWYYVFKRERK